MSRATANDEGMAMTEEEIREWITGRTLSLPYRIATRGGETYWVEDHSNAWIAAAYPDTLLLAIPKKGILRLGLGAIDSIRDESEDRGKS